MQLSLFMYKGWVPAKCNHDFQEAYNMMSFSCGFQSLVVHYFMAFDEVGHMLGRQSEFLDNCL